MTTKAQITPEQYVYRVPGVSVFRGQAPKQDVPPEPLLLAIEMLSRDGRYLREYPLEPTQSVLLSDL